MPSLTVAIRRNARQPRYNRFSIPWHSCSMNSGCPPKPVCCRDWRQRLLLLLERFFKLWFPLSPSALGLWRTSRASPYQRPLKSCFRPLLHQQAVRINKVCVRHAKAHLLWRSSYPQKPVRSPLYARQLQPRQSFPDLIIMA